MSLAVVPVRAVSIAEDLAKKFEQFAELARAGEIVSAGWVIEENQGYVTAGWLRDPKEGGMHQLVAGASYLHHRLTAAAVAAGEDRDRDSK